MPLFYTAPQVNAQGTAVATKIKEATDADAIFAKLDARPNTNLLTDAERTKLAGLESSKFVGTFTTAGAIPTVGAGPGSYADVDAGPGEDVKRYIYDQDSASFVAMVGGVAGETAASIKTKYESNANTNAFTDADKAKLDDITVAADITDWTAAFEAALA